MSIALVLLGAVLFYNPVKRRKLGQESRGTPGAIHCAANIERGELVKVYTI